MRHARSLPPILLALTVAACARQQTSYYLADAATGRHVSTAQQSASGRARGMFAQSTLQTTASRSYAYAPAERQTSGGRGLFNSDIVGSSSPAPSHVYRRQTVQTYAYRPPQQARSAQQANQQASQPVIMQYHPPQPARQVYAQQTAAMPYRQPQPQPAGYYAERYRWY